MAQASIEAFPADDESVAPSKALDAEMIPDGADASHQLLATATNDTEQEIAGDGEISVPKTISFKARTPTGNLFAIKEVAPTTTVLQIKQIIAKQDGMLRPIQIKLVLKGKPLMEDTMTIEEAGINENTVLHVIKRLDVSAEEDKEAEGVMVKIESTPEKDRGVIKFRVPPGSPGNYVNITPPGGQTLKVMIPATSVVGSLMQVRIPAPVAAPPVPRPPVTNTPSNSRQMRQPPRTAPAPSSSNSSGSTLMKVMTPINVKPGDKLQMRAPDGRKIQVEVPATARPGQYFYFRVKNA